MPNRRGTFSDAENCLRRNFSLLSFSFDRACNISQLETGRAPGEIIIFDERVFVLLFARVRFSLLTFNCPTQTVLLYRPRRKRDTFIQRLVEFLLRHS